MELTFEMGGEFVKVRIQGSNITFTDSTTNFQQYVPIEMIKLDREGILKEFPDIKKYLLEINFTELKKEAIRRQKWLIENLGGENKIQEYIIKELESKGYSLKLIEKEGFRPKQI